jgi:hypothetical protein
MATATTLPDGPTPSKQFEHEESHTRTRFQRGYALAQVAIKKSRRDFASSARAARSRNIPTTTGRPNETRDPSRRSPDIDSWPGPAGYSLLSGLQLRGELIDCRHVIERGKVGVTCQGVALFAVNQDLYFQNVWRVGRDRVDERSYGQFLD